MGKTFKFYISADIEGTTGACTWQETEKGNREYERQRTIMNQEVLTAVRTINSIEDAEIVIKDAHDSGLNLDPSLFPENCTIIRGWDRGPYSMMQGIDDSYDGVFFIGYHSSASSPRSPLAHSFSSVRYSKLTLNGQPASELLINTYIAWMHDVPILFISGDRGICEDAEAILDHIETVATMDGLGDSVIAQSPNKTYDDIEDAIRRALDKLEVSKPEFKLPNHFDLRLEYKKISFAHRASFYPGAERLDERTIRLQSNDFEDIIRAMMFI